VEESYGNFTQEVLREVGCQGATDEVECVRGIPAHELANLPLEPAVAKFPVMDGKYLLNRTFLLDGSGPLYAKDIPLMTGVTRDEAALFSTTYLAGIPWDSLDFETWTQVVYGNQDFFRLNADAIFNNMALFGVSPESTGERFFNATIHVLTLSMYTCLDRAQAYSAAKNKVFDKVYSFNFHRTYSPPPNDSPACSAPKTAERPFGDPQAEYYRCHGGSQVTMFGNHVRMDMPDRDGLDQDFSRLVVDYFSSFVRTGNPNVDESYLVARGYNSTLTQVRAVGRWDEVDYEAPEWMILDWDGFMAPFGEADLCAILEQPLDYWESSR
jgi:carboxylesterase type B